jgi:adenylate cyclase
MKRCPECRRDYLDETLLYCLDDGTALLDGPASLPNDDEPQTAILHDTDISSGAGTKAIIQTTDTLGTVDVPQSGHRLWAIVVIAAAVVIILGGSLFGLRYFRADAKQINSIAVMPFVNESGNPDNDYLTDGMTDMLISSLSQVPNLSVKAHTSVFRYKGRDTAPKTIANDLQVQALLNGRVTQHGDQLSVNVDLVDPQTENVLWTQKYDRKQSDVVSLQSEIATDVSSKLRARLSGEDQAKIRKTYTVDPEAYQLYLKGEFYWHKRGSDQLRKAAEFYNQAIEKDPTYALAYAGLAQTYTLYPDYAISKAEDSYPKSKAAALKALELDDSLAEPHTVLARYYNYWEWDRMKAEQEYRRAVELKPNFATAHQWLGSDVLTQLGRFDEALAEGGRARELDPLSAIIAVNYGDTLFNARRYDEAIAAYKKAIALDPDFYISYNGLGNALTLMGNYREAIQADQRSMNSALSKSYLAYAFAKSGNKDGARRLIDSMKKDAESDYVPSYGFAIAYAALGQTDEAISWLNKEIDEHGTGAATIGVDPLVDDLRNDPRFKEALKRVKLAE